MKTMLTPIIAVATLTIGFAVPVFAADKMEHMEHGMDHGSMHAATADRALADGVVKKLDKTAGKVTVTHGPLPNGMPSMTMAFRIKDSALLDKVKEGQKIRFAIDDTMTIVRLEAAQ